MEWKHKIAVITGASTGIGKATKELLRSKGAIVYNLDRNKPGEEDTHFIFCDVSKKDNVGTAIDQVFEKEKRIDMLFANGGVPLFATLEETAYNCFFRKYSRLKI